MDSPKTAEDPPGRDGAGRMKILRTLSRWLFGLLFMVAGVLHFVAPAFYLKIMPPTSRFISRSCISAVCLRSAWGRCFWFANGHVWRAGD